MAPTRIYVKPLLQLMREVPLHGLSHITGGGLVDNIPRVLPDGLEVVLERSSWRREAVFDWLQREGKVADAEMYRVFNCGIGMTVQVSASDAQPRHRHIAGGGPGGAHDRRGARRNTRRRHRLNTAPPRQPIVILISGRGSNMRALIERSRQRDAAYTVVPGDSPTEPMPEAS